MSNKALYICWGALYAITAGFGFIVVQDSFAYGVLLLFALLFFLPPAILLHRAVQKGDRKGIKVIFIASACSLALTMLLFILNILTVAASETTGLFMYVLLVLFSAPMFCGQIKFISLFLWACLLTVSIRQLRKKES